MRTRNLLVYFRKSDNYVDNHRSIGGSSVIEKNSQNDGSSDITVDVITIDQYVLNNKLDKVDFIKADIEGSEKRMLLGAVKTLKRDKPKLAICTYHNPSDRDDLTSIIRSANSNYKFYYSSHKLYAI